jgi:hypothetical protein
LSERDAVSNWQTRDGEFVAEVVARLSSSELSGDRFGTFLLLLKCRCHDAKEGWMSSQRCGVIRAKALGPQLRVVARSGSRKNICSLILQSQQGVH